MVWTTEKKVFEELTKREISFLCIWYVYVVAQFYPLFKGDFLLFLGVSQNILPLLKYRVISIIFKSYLTILGPCY